MSKPPSIKKGDTIPLNGIIKITQDGVDQTANEDFTQWSISCDVKDSVGVKVLDVPVEFFGNTPAFSGEITSAMSDTLTVGMLYALDMRFRDGLDDVKSTGTMNFKIVAPVSELPA